MTYYAPGLGEKDTDKVIRSVQQAHEKTATNTTDIATNTTNIATNTANIATNTTSIATNTANIATNTTNITALQAITAATQAEQEAGTSLVKWVAPGRQQYHPSAAKAWVNFTGSTGGTNGSYNVTSVSRSGTGSYTVTFTTAFSSAANYVGAGSTEHNAANSVVKFASGVNKTTTTISVFAINLATNALVDPDFVNVMFYGDQ